MAVAEEVGHLPRGRGTCQVDVASVEGRASGKGRGTFRVGVASAEVGVAWI